jgi:hypothetical protein
LLEDQIHKARAGANKYIRLRGSPAKCSLAIDEQEGDDHVLSRNGQKLLLLDPRIWERFRGVTIDCEDTPKGRALRFRSRRKHARSPETRE